MTGLDLFLEWLVVQVARFIEWAFGGGRELAR
jgi:hypothetical protein